MYHPVGKPVKGMVQIIVSLFSNVFNQGQTNEEFMFRFLFAYLFMFRIFVWSPKVCSNVFITFKPNREVFIDPDGNKQCRIKAHQWIYLVQTDM